jgi:hypothetical protein
LDSLRAAGFDPRPADLAASPTDELLRLSGIESREQLEALTRTLYDAEERRRILSGAAAAWRSELRLLGILSRTSPVEGRAAIRLQAEAVDAMLPLNLSSPTELRPSLADLLPGRESLRAALYAMNERGLRVAVPDGLGRPAPRPDRPAKRRKIKAIKVSPSADRRKRQLGEHGERWALAAMIRELTDMPSAQRNAAIDEMLKLLDGFEGSPVEAVRAKAEAARALDLEEDERIDELAGFLHVAAQSDAFGFDMLGWIAVPETEEVRAMLVEVKSSADGTFHLSPNEWERAEQFEDRYSVLVVRRTPSGTKNQ